MSGLRTVSASDRILAAGSPAGLTDEDLAVALGLALIFVACQPWWCLRGRVRGWLALVWVELESMSRAHRGPGVREKRRALAISAAVVARCRAPDQGLGEAAGTRARVGSEARAPEQGLAAKRGP